LWKREVDFGEAAADGREKKAKSKGRGSSDYLAAGIEGRCGGV